MNNATTPDMLPDDAKPLGISPPATTAPASSNQPKGSPPAENLVEQALIDLQAELDNFVGLKHDFEKFIRSLNDFEERVKSLQAETEAIETTVGESKSQLESTKTRQLAIAKQVGDITRGLDEAKLLLPEIEKKWTEASNALIEEASTKLRTEIKVRLDPIAESLSAYEMRFSEIEEKLAKQSAGLNERVDELAAACTKRLGDVARAAEGVFSDTLTRVMTRLDKLEVETQERVRLLTESASAAIAAIQKEVNKERESAITAYRLMYEEARQKSLKESQQQIVVELDRIKQQVMPEVKQVGDTVRRLVDHAKKPGFVNLLSGMK